MAMTSDENTLKVGVGLARQPRAISGAFGKVCLTDRRLIWNPGSLYTKLLRFKPFIRELSELKGWKVGRGSIWYGFPVVLETSEGSFWLYIHSPEILYARALRSTAKEWVTAIEEATTKRT